MKSIAQRTDWRRLIPAASTKYQGIILLDGDFLLQKQKEKQKQKQKQKQI